MASARAKKREPMGEAGLFDYAVAALSRRMRTERELRGLMRARAFDGAAGAADIDRVVLRLVELNYLSDARFAQDFTRLRKENQGFGRRRVAQELGAKGVVGELADAALDQAFGESDEVELARAFCERKRIAHPNEPKAVQRVMGRLMRAGYSAGAICKLMKEWRVEVDPSELLTRMTRIGPVRTDKQGMASTRVNPSDPC